MFILKSSSGNGNVHACCNAPEEIYKSHTLANVFYKSSEGFSTPVTSPLMPPKPARTERKHYSWRNSSKREICMYIRVLDPLELRNDGRKESMYENKRSMNYREAEYLFPDGEGMVTSSDSNTSTLWNVSVNKLFARQRWKSSDHLCSFAEEGCRKVFKSYNKVVTVVTFYCLLVTQVLEVITSPRRCERKSTVGNSEGFSSSKSVRDYGSYTFYTVLECLGDILGYKLKLWLFLIIHGLWRKYGVMRNKDKEIWKFMNTLTFRLVVARPWLRNLLLGNVLETFSVRIGNAGNTFSVERYLITCCCLYADFWASCRIYLYMCTIILELCGKFRKFHAYIYLYIYKSYRLRLSCKWASYPWLSQLNCILWFIFHQKQVF